MLNRIIVVDAPRSSSNKATYLPRKQKLDAVDDRTLSFSVRPKQDETLPFEIKVAVRETAEMLKPNCANHLTHWAPPVELGLLSGVPQ